MPKHTFFAIFLVVAAMAVYPARSQRSPYVPMPVNLPGLLPRFGEVDNAGESQPAASSATQAPPARRPASSNEGDAVDFGNRFGEERPGRPAVNNDCPVPCYDCMVYISSTGQITRFAANQRGRRI